MLSRLISIAILTISQNSLIRNLGIQALILWLRYALVSLQFGDKAKLGRQSKIQQEVNKDQASLLKHPIVKIAK